MKDLKLKVNEEINKTPILEIPEQVEIKFLTRLKDFVSLRIK